MENLNSTQYVVKREADRWMFIPSPLFAGVMIGAFFAGSAFMIACLRYFFGGRTRLPRLCGSARFSCSSRVCPQAWGFAPGAPVALHLSIETGGRLSYSERELCAAGTVRAVRIAESRGGEPGDCEAVLEVADGKMVSIPSRTSPSSTRVNMRARSRRNSHKRWAFKFWSPGNKIRSPRKLVMVSTQENTAVTRVSLSLLLCERPDR